MEDAQSAIDCGADALGFNFYEPSIRFITPEYVSEIKKQISPFVTTVGLVVNADENRIKEIVRIAAPDLLQFHGDETNEFCRSFGRPFIKVLRMPTSLPVEEVVDRYPDATGILLDTLVESQAGGTGKSFDWKLIPDSLGKPVILAGGLNSENVTQAIQDVSPYAVDVSSGVETDGFKDSAKIKSFFKSVASA